MKSLWENLSLMSEKFNSDADLMTQQENWLLDCIKRNEKTRYGLQYQFHKITNIDDFRKQVPIVTYEDLRPWINKIANGEKDILFKGSALAFEKTSGSTLEAKLIPYSEHSLYDFQKAILPWLVNLADGFNLTGCAYWSISPALRTPEFTPSGIAIGMEDGAYLGEAAMIISHLSAVPQTVSDASNLEDWQLITLYWLIRRKNLEFISVWSPTFLLMLMEALNKLIEPLITIFLNGGLVAGQYLNADKHAYQRLIQFKKNKDFSLLWSELKLVSCWGDGVSEKFHQQLQQQLPFVAFQKKGLLSTEGIITVPDRDNEPVLAENSGFFEFLSRDGNTYLADELKENTQYEVILTTSGGLYRYKTGDCVICEKYKITASTKKRIPVLSFTGRTRIISDMVGEKLTEAFVAECLKTVEGFYMLVTDIKKKAGYTLVLDQRCIQLKNLESIKKEIEKSLSQNPQYAYARQIEQLEKLAIQLVSNPLEKYIAYKVATGSKLGDIKVPVLSKDNRWLVL